MRSIISLALILFSSSALAQTPGLNTVPFFGSTAMKNHKHGCTEAESKQFGCTHYKNHNSYSNWIRPGSITAVTPMGQSCCNGSNEAGDGKGDCDIVRTYVDENDDTLHYVYYRDKRIDLPNSLRVREADNVTNKQSPDGQSHACIAEWIIGMPVVLCWVKGDGMK